MFSLFKNKHNAIGINIADHTIEIAELRKKNSNTEIIKLERIRLEAGIIENGKIKNKKKLTELIKIFFENIKLEYKKDKEIILNLPDSQIYTLIIDLKKCSKKEKEKLILEQIKKNIPLEQDDILYSYQVLLNNKKEKKESILLVAASKKIVLEWLSFFKEIDIKIKIFDIEILAIFRSLVSDVSKSVICLVDVGDIVTNISIFNKGILNYSYPIFQAGNMFTEEIAKEFNVSWEKAEEGKKKIDLTKNNKLSSFILKLFKQLLKELDRTIKYWENKNNIKIDNIVLVGGSAKFNGLENYFSNILKINTILGNKKENLIYSAAIGSAMRGIDNKWKKDLTINLK